MTTCYNMSNYHQKLPHIPFAHVLKKACLQQEQTISVLQAQLHLEQNKAAMSPKEDETLSKNMEIENIKKGCEAKELAMLKLKEKVEML